MHSITISLGKYRLETTIQKDLSPPTDIDKGSGASYRPTMVGRLTYGDLLEELQTVAPFRALSLGKQRVPLLSALLHPPFERLVMLPAARVMCGLNRLQFASFEIQHHHRIPRARTTPIIYISNHLSYLDPPLVGAAVARHSAKTPWFMAKKRLWQEWHYRISFGLLGALPFQRRGEHWEDHIDCLKVFISVLKAGQSLIIYPEGTIPGEIELAKKGITRLRSDVEAQTGLLRGGALVPLLARASGAKIVPVGLSGAGRALPPEVHPGKIWKPRPKKDHVVQIRFGEPLDVPLAVRDDADFERFTQDIMMPALSLQVDFSLHEVPVNTPLTAQDYARLRAFEVKVAQEYLAQGKFEHAEKIKACLAAQESFRDALGS